MLQQVVHSRHINLQIQQTAQNTKKKRSFLYFIYFLNSESNVPVQGSCTVIVKSQLDSQLVTLTISEYTPYRVQGSCTLTSSEYTPYRVQGSCTLTSSEFYVPVQGSCTQLLILRYIVIASQLDTVTHSIQRTSARIVHIASTFKVYSHSQPVRHNHSLNSTYQCKDRAQCRSQSHSNT